MVDKIINSIKKFELDLSGKTILTEAASGNYVVTPIIAAYAGADVIAITKKSRHGTVYDIEKQTYALAKSMNVEEKIKIVDNKNCIDYSIFDVVTNTGFVRPIDNTIISALSPSCVIPLMWEPWEFRNEDLFFYLNSLNNRVLRLSEILSLNENINDLELTLETLKPKVFWKDKPKLTEQLKKWNAIRLQKVLKKVSKLELDFKTNNNRNDIVFKRLLVNLCQEASNF